jgi:hypothetical protein
MTVPSTKRGAKSAKPDTGGVARTWHMQDADFVAPAIGEKVHYAKPAGLKLSGSHFRRSCRWNLGLWTAACWFDWPHCNTDPPINPMWNNFQQSPAVYDCRVRHKVFIIRIRRMT